MFDDEKIARRATFVAGLILLIVLAAVAALSAETAVEHGEFALVREPTRRAIGERVGPALQRGIWDRTIAALRPIERPVSGVFPDSALIVYDLGIAPMTQGLLGASIYSERVAGYEVIGMRLDSLLPAWVPLPSPSYAVAGDYLIVSPVRSAVAETVVRITDGPPVPDTSVGEETVVEVVRLNFPAWPETWRRAEPVFGAVIDRLGGESTGVLRACSSLIELAGALGPAHGTTTLTPEGGFIFHLYVAPRSERGGQ